MTFPSRPRPIGTRSRTRSVPRTSERTRPLAARATFDLEHGRVERPLPVVDELGSSSAIRSTAAPRPRP
jgi:hypothetical protein